MEGDEEAEKGRREQVEGKRGSRQKAKEKGRNGGLKGDGRESIPDASNSQLLRE